jgi:hypothetical protein
MPFVRRIFDQKNGALLEAPLFAIASLQLELSCQAEKKLMPRGVVSIIKVAGRCTVIAEACSFFERREKKGDCR